MEDFLHLSRLNYPAYNCIYCSSKETYVVQLRKNVSSIKPIYRCRKCNRRFTSNSVFKKFRHPETIIKTSLNLLQNGFSLGEVKHYLNSNFRTAVTRKTILDWKRKFPS